MEKAKWCDCVGKYLDMRWSISHQLKVAIHIIPKMKTTGPKDQTPGISALGPRKNNPSQTSAYKLYGEDEELEERGK